MTWSFRIWSIQPSMTSFSGRLKAELFRRAYGTDLTPMWQLSVNSLHEHKYSYLLTTDCINRIYVIFRRNLKSNFKTLNGHRLRTTCSLYTKFQIQAFNRSRETACRKMAMLVSQPSTQLALSDAAEPQLWQEHYTAATTLCSVVNQKTRTENDWT